MTVSTLLASYFFRSKADYSKEKKSREGNKKEKIKKKMKKKENKKKTNWIHKDLMSGTVINPGENLYNFVVFGISKHRSYYEATRKLLGLIST